MNILSYNPGHDGAFAYLEGDIWWPLLKLRNTRIIDTHHSPFRMCLAFSVNSKKYPTCFVEAGGGLATPTCLNSPLLRDTVAC
jgi:hypothetical protein